jgi:hypothetical protein
VLGIEYITSEGEVDQVNVAKVLKDLSEDKNKNLEFYQNLRAQPSSVDGVNAVEAVEWVMLDFDLVALPLYLGIESAREVAEAYRIVFEATAREILPFVAIQKKLRGTSDPKYKMHYLYLLSELKIPLQGFPALAEK